MIRTGEEYRAGLRDGREIWIDGERVHDVTVHPAFNRRHGKGSHGTLYFGNFYKTTTSASEIPLVIGHAFSSRLS
jgi:aromatic ring hydroxylase